MHQKQYIVLLTILLGILVACSSKKEGRETDWKKYDLNGAVRCCKEESYNVFSDSLKEEKEMVTSTQYCFNQQGYLTDLILSYHKDSTAISKMNYHYAYKDDTMMVQRCVDVNSNKELSHKKTYIDYTAKYNADGHKVETYVYSSNGAVNSKTKSVYNDKGLLLETINYDLNGKQNYRNVFEYDENGNIKLRRIYSPQDEVINTSVFQYNTNGDKIGIVVYNKNEDVVYSCTYKYNDHHQLLEECSYVSKGDLKYKIINQYNADGDMVSQLMYDKNGTLKNELEYTYDGHHNWVERKKYLNGNELVHIMKRIYVYY